MPEEVKLIKLTDEKALKLIIEIFNEIGYSYKLESTEKWLENKNLDEQYVDGGILFSSQTEIGVRELKDVGLTYQGKEISLDDEELFLRWIQPGPHPNPLRREDSYFGGERSVEREAKLIQLLGEESDLPAPKVIYAAYRGDEGKFLITEMPKGIRAIKFLETNADSLDSFLTLLEFLGQDIAKAHSVTFNKFGSILADGVTPPGTASVRTHVKNYGEYIQRIIDRHLTDNNIGILKKYFKGNFDKLTKHINDVIEYAKNELKDNIEPCLVLYDQHLRNFNVDEKTGKPSAYYNLEYCQAAHPSLELGAAGFQLFGFFPNHVKEAREAFMKGYKAEGGSDIINDEKLETIHAVNHILSAVNNYDHFSKDENSERKTWSQDFANLTLKIIDDGKVNNDTYATFTNIIKPITKQDTEK